MLLRNDLGFIFMVVLYLAYWVGMAAIIHVDAKRQVAAARARGEVDFADRNPRRYMLLGFLCGPLPLIMYFGSTRRSAAGWLLGLGIGLGWTFVIGTGLNLIVHSP